MEDFRPPHHDRLELGAGFGLDVTPDGIVGRVEEGRVKRPHCDSTDYGHEVSSRNVIAVWQRNVEMSSYSNCKVVVVQLERTFLRILR